MSQEIITRIENFAVRSGKSESTIARKGFNDGKTWTRLRNGCLLYTSPSPRD